MFETDEPIIIRVRHELGEPQVRLVTALGAQVIVDPEAEPCVGECGREECAVSARRTNERVSALGLGMASLHSQGKHDWEPNWIDYRASVANVDRRQDRDEDVEICKECGCEADVSPAPHSPKCPTLAEASNGTGHEELEHGRDLLDRMDDGESLREPDSEPKEMAEMAAESADEHGSAPKNKGGVPPKWTRETVVAAIREVGEKVGGTPRIKDMADAGYISATVNTTLDRIGARWAEVVEDAGFEPRRRGARKASGREPKARTEETRTSHDGAQRVSADENQPSRPEGNEEEPAATLAPTSRNMTAAGSSLDIGPLELIRLIQLLDDGTLTVTRWNNGEGDQDEAAESLIRQIARDSLGGYGVDEIGSAIIEALDREAA